MKFLKTIVFVAAATILFIASLSAHAQTWSLTSAPFTNWSAVASSANGTVWYASAGQTYVINGFENPNFNSPIYCSTNSGRAWQATTAPYTTWSTIACSADGTHVAAAINGGSIYISANSGATWTLTSAPVEMWTSIAASAAGDKLVAAAQNVIYTSANYGSTWVSNNVPADSWQRVVSSANGHILFACEIGVVGTQIAGSIYVSSNSGATWAATGAPQLEWRSLACSADGTKVVGGPAEGIGNVPLYFSSDSGNSWNAGVSPTGYWKAVASSADGSKLVAASAYAIYTSADGGNTWTPNSAPQNYWNAVGMCADGSELAATSSQDGDEGLYLYQSTPSPRLNLTPAQGKLTVSWVIPTTNFVLQQCSDLITWSDVTNSPALNPTNLQNQITISPSNRSGFYRLATP